MALLENSSSVNIKAWQKFLNDQGIKDSHDHALVADGIWGPNSGSATATFQSKHGLNPDQKIGSQTLAVAEKLGFKMPTSISSSSSSHSSVPANNQDTVFDISHHNKFDDNPPKKFDSQASSAAFQAAKAAGLKLVIHKACGGFTNDLLPDSRYALRKPIAEAAGLLWGAYYWGNGTHSGTDQANDFLDFLEQNGGAEGILIVLDFERNGYYDKQGNFKDYGDMTKAQAKDFVIQVHARTGKYPGIYGGANLRNAMTEPDEILSKCWLWVAEYKNHGSPRLPVCWDEYAFWQYTSKKNVPQIGDCDRDYFNSNQMNLEDFYNTNKIETVSPRTTV